MRFELCVSAPPRQDFALSIPASDCAVRGGGTDPLQTRRNLLFALLAAAAAALAQNTVQPSDIAGHWTWYQRADNAGGRFAAGTSREIWISTAGRFKYVSTVYVPNMPRDINPTRTVTGSYQLRGNTIVASYDGGGQESFALQLVPGGKGMRLNGELYIRE